MCVLLSLMFLGPRGAGLIWWLGWPTRWDVTFDNSSIVPLLGILFLPWTTLMYVAVAPYGVNGFDYVLIGLSVAIDVASYGSGGAYGRRRQSSAATY